MGRNITIKDERENTLINQLDKEGDINAKRIKRLLEIEDLTKKENSPIKILVDEILKLTRFAEFDLVDFPRVVSVEENFDVLNTPKDHPSRRKTDTYYLLDTQVLRTHTTTMWPFYLRKKEILEKLEKDGWVGALSTGIVFRKDEIDRKHFPAFHQIDGLYVCKKSEKKLEQKDLEDVLVDVAKSIFGKDIEYSFTVESFPFTDPSVEMNLKFNGEWMEILGSGLVHSKVLENLNIDPDIYNGWAFGMGIERLAMVKFDIPDIRVFWSNDKRITNQFKDINSKYKEVSKYPEVIRDISFVVQKSVNLNNYYELIRDLADNLIEEVKLIDSYESEEKFGKDKKSYTFRILYRSLEKTLTDKEVNVVHDKIIEVTKDNLNAQIR